MPSENILTNINNTVMKKLLITLLSVIAVLQVKAQIPVTDVAANTNLIATIATLGEQLTTLIEHKNKLDESLDFMRKLNTNITTAKSVKYIAERQIDLSKKCSKLMKTEGLSPEGMLTLTTTVESVSSNNRRLIQLTNSLLSSGVKMNDAERLNALRDIEKSIIEDEKKINKCSYLIREYQSLKNLLK